MPQGQGYQPSEVHIKIENAASTNSEHSNTNAFHVAIVDVSLKKDPGGAGSNEGSDSRHEYLCGFCDRLYRSPEELSSHTCFKNSNLSVLYECQECKKFFESLPVLAEHIKTHEKQVIMKTDTQSVHVPRLNYRCGLCDKFLCSKGSLVKHQQLHMGLKPYCCNFCNKSFSLKGNRDKHELIHAGERPHKCCVCEKSFTLKGNLQKHILTHTSLKMFKCHLCSSEFTLKGNLSKHIKRHQQGMVNPPRKKSKNETCGIKIGSETCSNKNEASGNMTSSVTREQMNSVQPVDENMFGVTGQSDSTAVYELSSDKTRSTDKPESVEDSAENEIQNC